MKTDNLFDINGQLQERINYDSILELKYLGMCLQESMRLDPPIWYSSTFEMTKTSKIGPYFVNTSTEVILNYHSIAHDPE